MVCALLILHERMIQCGEKVYRNYCQSTECNKKFYKKLSYHKKR